LVILVFSISRLEQGRENLNLKQVQKMLARDPPGMDWWALTLCETH
jgi:hypothetical protein